MPMTQGLGSVGTNGGVALLTTAAASFDSGVQMNEASGYTNWRFQLTGTFTGYSVQLYGTIDPAAKNSIVPGQSLVSHGDTTTVPATSWFALDAPAVAVGTESNPLTAAGQSLKHSGPLVAVRAVATGSSQTGSVTVLGFAAP